MAILHIKVIKPADASRPVMTQELGLVMEDGKSGLQDLSEGISGAVQKAVCSRWGHIAVKWAKMGEDAAGFDKEADSLSMFRHPNVVEYLGRVVDPVLHSNCPGIAMERMHSTLAETFVDG